MRGSIFNLSTKLQPSGIKATARTGKYVMLRFLPRGQLGNAWYQGIGRKPKGISKKVPFTKWKATALMTDTGILIVRLVRAYLVFGNFSHSEEG